MSIFTYLHIALSKYVGYLSSGVIHIGVYCTRTWDLRPNCRNFCKNLIQNEDKIMTIQNLGSKQGTLKKYNTLT